MTRIEGSDPGPGAGTRRAGGGLARRRGALVLGSTFVVSAASAALAVAHQDGTTTYDRHGHYSCRASAARVVTFLPPPFQKFEPVVANDKNTPPPSDTRDQADNPNGDPCRRDKESLVEFPPPGSSGSSSSPLHVKAATAQTHVQPEGLDHSGFDPVTGQQRAHSHTAPAHNDRALATASVASAKLSRIPNVIKGVDEQKPPDQWGTLEVTTEVVKSTVYTFCHCQYPSREFETRFKSSSTVQGMKVVEREPIAAGGSITNTMYPAVTTSTLRRITVENPSDSRDRLEITLNADENKNPAQPALPTGDNHQHTSRTRRAVQVIAYNDDQVVFEGVIAEATADFFGNPCEFDEVRAS